MWDRYGVDKASVFGLRHILDVHWSGIKTKCIFCHFPIIFSICLFEGIYICDGDTQGNIRGVWPKGVVRAMGTFG